MEQKSNQYWFINVLKRTKDFEENKCLDFTDSYFLRISFFTTLAQFTGLKINAEDYS